MRGNSLSELLMAKAHLVDKGVTIIEGNDREKFLSYPDLYEAALHGLYYLQQAGLQPKDELVFQIDDYRTFLVSFWACILGGIVPVPLTIGQNDEHKQKLINVWSVLNNPRLLTTPDSLKKLQAFTETKGLGECFAEIERNTLFGEEIHASQPKGEVYSAGEDDIAFIQFSSGSTGSPKGVILTHKNLLTNIAAISEAAGYNAGDSMLSWMPLTHDMGLIGFHLNPLFDGIDHYLIPTHNFIRRPALWFDKASEHKTTVLCSPNFGYRYILKNTPDADKYNWDLSGVRILYNGAEPISEQLCTEFQDRFSASGLKAGVIRPVYGLAEATLAVSFSNLNEGIISLNLDRNSLNAGDKISIKEQGEDTVGFINVGKAVSNCLLRITDRDHRPAAGGTIGYVQIKGPNVTAGYYNNPKETAAVLTNDGWLDTGDMGFMQGEELYITGRAKDIIFVNGQNYYPHDLERVAEEVPGVELNKIVITGYFDAKAEKDKTLAFLFHRGDTEAFHPIAKELVKHINDKIGFQLDIVLPVKDIPRTTSGKLQRFKLLEQYLKGQFFDVLLTLNQPAANQPEAVAQPATETEELLYQTWSRVLGIKNFGVDQSFFHLGGNSLKAAETGMLLLKQFNVDLSIDLLYEKPTIRELAAIIGKSPRKNYVPIPVASERAWYPATSAQKRLYYFWEMDKTSIAYNIPLALQIKGSLNSATLADCFNKLIGRHDSLRMSFHLQGEPVFKIAPTLPFQLSCATIDARVLETELKSMVQPFDLSQGSLFRSKLYKTGKNEHYLFLDFHHIISDGLSVHYFIDELMKTYLSQELPPLPVRYSDYALIEKEQLSTGRLRSLEEYWLGRLRGELPVLEMPIDFRRPLLFDTTGEKLAFTLEKPVTDRLKALAASQQCTMHVLLFTIYNVLLSRYTAQEDLVVGIPVSGRTLPDIQRVQGMFVNNLAIRSVIKGHELFNELLQKESAIVKEALYNQDYPFSELTQRAGGSRDMSRNPVLDTMFVYQNMGFPDSGTPELSLTRHFFDAGISKFDLSLEVFESGDILEYYIEYATTLFKKDSISDLAAHFEQLITRILDNPASRLTDLPAISDAEFDLFVRQFNNTGRSYPKNTTVHQLFEEQVFKTPDEIAIVYEAEAITYRQLNERADLLAGVLKQKGIVPDMVAGILLKRSPELIVSILAVLKAGGCYLPIDTDLPVKRVEYLVSDSKCRVLIVAADSAHLLPPLPAQGVEVLYIDHPMPSVLPVPNTRSIGAAGNLAYIIYTSGTTGNPKGVMIEHQSAINYISWASAEYTKGRKSAFPLFTSISFDLTVTSVFVPLLTGGTLHIYKEDDQHLLIEKVVVDNKVDVIKLTPSHLKILAAGNLPIDVKTNKIKAFIVGGEQLETWLAKKIHDKFGGNIEIYNEYGPTEATVGCMIYPFQPGDTFSNVPIGIPAANTSIFVLDKYLHPVPAGVIGDIYISGDGLARGYLFNHSLTGQKFIPNPFTPHKKMYKTGDLGIRLSNGIITYIGRRDQQVKLNGYRLELNEIESSLLGLEKIEQALVVVKKKQNGQQSLYAYYISPEELEESTLRSFLSDRLPHYMIPAQFIRIDDIPLTKNGKVDHQALPENRSGRATRKILPAQNQLERLFVKIWEEMLVEESISVTDNFFELGGDSIKAVQIASRLLDEGIQVAVKDILLYHTIEQICQHAQIANDKSSAPQGLVTGEKGLVPIEGWFFEQAFANPGHYNQSVLLLCKKKLEVPLLEAAFKKLIAHHDGLRLNYNPEKRNLFYNSGLLEKKILIEVFNTSPDDVSWSAINEERGFTIQHDLLLKAAIIRRRNGEERLLITAHHLVVDGVSWRILLEDLYTIYNSLEKNEVVKLPFKTASLIEWEKKLVEYGNSQDFDNRQAYWKEVENCRFTIPLDYETSDWKTRNVRVHSATLSKEKTAFLLKEAHRTYKTDIPILLNTALAIVLRQWTGLETFVIEQEGHGRHLEDIDVTRTTGWFTSLYPVKLELKGDHIGSYVRAIKEQLRMVPGQGIDYGVQKYCGNTGQPKRKIFTEIRLNYLGRFDSELSNDLFTFCYNATPTDIDPENNMSTKLEINAMIVAGELLFEIRYNKKAHKKKTIHWLIDTIFLNLELIFKHLQNEKEEHFTPSDFSVSLDQEELDGLFN